MWQLTGGILALCFLSLLVYFIRAEGKKAERLEALKKEAKERARAQRITNNVNAMSADDARRRLHDLANKRK